MIKANRKPINSTFDYAGQKDKYKKGLPNRRQSFRTALSLSRQTNANKCRSEDRLHLRWFLLSVPCLENQGLGKFRFYSNIKMKM